MCIEDCGQVLLYVPTYIISFNLYNNPESDIMPIIQIQILKIEKLRNMNKVALPSGGVPKSQLFEIPTAFFQGQK